MKNFLFYMGVFVFLFGIACIICELHMIFKESRLVKEINAWLALAVIFPIMLYFWPFAMWNDSMLLLLRIIPAIAAQVLLFRVGKWNIVKGLPLLIAGVIAAWGTYLYFTSPHWSHAAFWGDLIADYVSPFISCLVALIACILAKKSCSVWIK